MVRPLRLHVPGGFYHVTLRGNHRQAIFFTASDHDLLDRVVAQVIARFGARVHAYCWMTNHLHLLVQVSETPLGRVILRIASAYARTVQARLATTGHLFERRYHAVLVDADNYLLTLLRYIHLNPVQAGLVSDPALYAWSSHRAYLGLGTCDWVTTHFALNLLAAQPVAALARYREFMGSPEPCRWGAGALAPHRDQPQILGGDEFVARMTAKPWRPRLNRSLDELIKDCGERFGIAPELLASPGRARELAEARAWISHQAVEGRVASICAVARRLGRSESAIRALMSRHPRGSGLK